MDTKDSMFVLAIVGIVAIVGVIILVTGTKASITQDMAGEAIVVAEQASLEGYGNAYACLDSYGNLYRSENPCR